MKHTLYDNQQSDSKKSLNTSGYMTQANRNAYKSVTKPGVRQIEEASDYGASDGVFLNHSALINPSTTQTSFNKGFKPTKNAEIPKLNKTEKSSSTTAPVSSHAQRRLASNSEKSGGIAKKPSEAESMRLTKFV